VSRNRRVVVEVSQEVHNEVKKLALLNDLKIYVLTNALLEDFLKDQDRVKALIKRLKL